ncbi:MAG: hypothetical protein R6V46_06290 [Desulfatiglandaceae bacterium]
MAKTRALKDAARDPLAGKENWAYQTNRKEPKQTSNGLAIIGAFILGLAGGIILRHFLKIRL